MNAPFPKRLTLPNLFFPSYKPTLVLVNSQCGRIRCLFIPLNRLHYTPNPFPRGTIRLSSRGISRGSDLRRHYIPSLGRISIVSHQGDYPPHGSHDVARSPDVVVKDLGYLCQDSVSISPVPCIKQEILVDWSSKKQRSPKLTATRHPNRNRNLTPRIPRPVKPNPPPHPNHQLLLPPPS